MGPQAVCDTQIQPRGDDLSLASQLLGHLARISKVLFLAGPATGHNMVICFAWFSLHARQDKRRAFHRS